MVQLSPAHQYLYLQPEAFNARQRQSRDYIAADEKSGRFQQLPAFALTAALFCDKDLQSSNGKDV